METVSKHRPKGILRSQVASFDHKQYLEQLRNPTENYAINRRLGSRLHKIYGIEVILTSILVSTHPTTLYSLVRSFTCHYPSICMS